MFGGIIKGLFGGGSSSGGTVDTSSVPGIFDDSANKTGREIAEFLKTKGEERFDKQIPPFVIPDSTPGFDFSSAISQSPVNQEFQRNLLNPSFDVTNPVEQAILNDLREQVCGLSALRNVGLINSPDNSSNFTKISARSKYSITKCFYYKYSICVGR